jgi:hypothetical protein
MPVLRPLNAPGVQGHRASYFSFVNRAAHLLKQGLITPERYQALVDHAHHSLGAALPDISAQGELTMHPEIPGKGYGSPPGHGDV